MAKKLADIQKEVEEAGSRFKSYLNRELPASANSLLAKLSKLTDVYIFSGVIRNFFLKKSGFRDLDIVLKNEVDVYQIFENYEIVKNSFGGFKITGKDIVIDLWFLENTWALKNNPSLPYPDPKEKFIAGTAFFNFSAIIYSLNEEKFYANRKFLRFIQDRIIDLVYEPNANRMLCVVNTLYYEDKYNLKISDRLKRYILHLYKELNSGYASTQQKHFGSVLYTDIEIRNRLTIYSESIKRKTAKHINSHQMFA